MSLHSILFSAPSISPLLRQRVALLAIIACFLLPLAAAWLLIGHWRPDGSVQHGELLNPARPVDLQLAGMDGGHFNTATKLRGQWVLAYIGSATVCEARCRAGLYDIRQVRLALGKDMDRVKTLLVLNGMPASTFRQWLATEHPAMTVGIADAVNRNNLTAAFAQPGPEGEWLYLLDPLGNLLMRYPVDIEPRGLLKDLQRLLKWSKIG